MAVDAAERTDEEREREEWERHEKWLVAYAFERTCVRRARKKRRCDCGHWVDGSIKADTGALYRYQVWKLNMDTTITQRTDCEMCARGDLRG